MRRSTRPRGGARWGRRTLAVRRAAACFLLPRVSSRGVISSARRLRASRVVGGHEARISSARASRPARATRALARRRGEARRRVRERRQESTIGCLTSHRRTRSDHCSPASFRARAKSRGFKVAVLGAEGLPYCTRSRHECPNETFIIRRVDLARARDSRARRASKWEDARPKAAPTGARAHARAPRPPRRGRDRDPRARALRRVGERRASPRRRRRRRRRRAPRVRRRRRRRRVRARRRRPSPSRATTTTTTTASPRARAPPGEQPRGRDLLRLRDGELEVRSAGSYLHRSPYDGVRVVKADP